MLRDIYQSCFSESLRAVVYAPTLVVIPRRELQIRSGIGVLGDDNSNSFEPRMHYFPRWTADLGRTTISIAQIPHYVAFLERD
jgi:hypothetical protein